MWFVLIIPVEARMRSQWKSNFRPLEFFFILNVSYLTFSTVFQINLSKGKFSEYFLWLVTPSYFKTVSASVSAATTMPMLSYFKRHWTEEYSSLFCSFLVLINFQTAFFIGCFECCLLLLLHASLAHYFRCFGFFSSRLCYLLCCLFDRGLRAVLGAQPEPHEEGRANERTQVEVG